MMTQNLGVIIQIFKEESFVKNQFKRPILKLQAQFIPCLYIGAKFRNDQGTKMVLKCGITSTALFN
jgi:hypothetical protein